MELLGAVFCAPLYITYFEFFHRAVQTVYILTFFMLPLSAVVKLRPMIVDLSIFFYILLLLVLHILKLYHWLLRTLRLFYTLTQVS